MENIWVDPKHIQDDHMAVLDKTVKDTISPFSERYDFEAELMSLFKQDDVAKRVLKMVADQSDAARKIRESIEITGFDFDTKQMPMQGINNIDGKKFDYSFFVGAVCSKKEPGEYSLNYADLVVIKHKLLNTFSGCKQEDCKDCWCYSHELSDCSANHKKLSTLIDHLVVGRKLKGMKLND